ncbi:MAG: hypothetical protein AAFU73_07340 [Planctomycetota bacterium]
MAENHLAPYLVPPSAPARRAHRAEELALVDAAVVVGVEAAEDAPEAARREGARLEALQVGHLDGAVAVEIQPSEQRNRSVDARGRAVAAVDRDAEELLGRTRVRRRVVRRARFDAQRHQIVRQAPELREAEQRVAREVVLLDHRRCRDVAPVVAVVEQDALHLDATDVAIEVEVVRHAELLGVARRLAPLEVRPERDRGLAAARELALEELGVLLEAEPPVVVLVEDPEARAVEGERTAGLAVGEPARAVGVGDLEPASALAFGRDAEGVVERALVCAERRPSVVAGRPG